MRISDWSSDVCSSDLRGVAGRLPADAAGRGRRRDGARHGAHRNLRRLDRAWPLGLSRRIAHRARQRGARMTRRLAMTAQQLLVPIDLAQASPRRIGTLVEHEGIMLEVSGFPQPLGSTVHSKAATGDKVNGEVAGFRGDLLL